MNQGFASESRPSFTIKCQEFVPIQTDPLERRWNSGHSAVALPPFAIASGQLAGTRRLLDRYLRDNLDMFMQELMFGQDPLVAMTLQEALRISPKVRSVRSSHCKSGLILGARAICYAAAL